MGLLLIGAPAGAQDRIALVPERIPFSTVPYGQHLQPAVSKAKTPRGFVVKDRFTVDFGGGSRNVAVGTWHGRSALVMDFAGVGDMARCKPCFEHPLSPAYGVYGPFELKWAVAGKRRSGNYRITAMKRNGAANYYLYGWIAMKGRGSLLGREVTVLLKDANSNGIFDEQDWLEIDWGGTSTIAHFGGGGIGIGGRFAKLKVDAAGTSLLAAPIRVQSNEVVVPAGLVIGDSRAAATRWVLCGEQGRIWVPAGTNLVSLQINKVQAGKTWSLFLGAPAVPEGQTADPPHEVRAEPLKMSLNVTRQGLDRVYSLSLAGPDHWRVVSLTADQMNPDPPVLELRAADGTLVDSPKFSYG
jgi:hypothetical protein